MFSDAQYVTRISGYDHSRLQELWEAIIVGDTPEWAPGKALEYLLLRAFQLEGADVSWPFRVALEEQGGETLEEIDGVVYTDGLACLVECKDRVERVNIEPIAKLRNQLLRRPGTALGIVVSRSGFTDPAVTLAQFTAPQTILLWDGSEVKHALGETCMRSALVKKYRFCVERGIPFYNITAEELP